LGNQLRICMVAFQFYPVVGGAESRAMKQAHQLRELGHEVTVITLRHQKEWDKLEDMDGVSIIRLGGIYTRQGTLRLGRLGHFPLDLLTFVKLWQLRNQFDILHAQQISTLCGAAALISKLTGKPLIISVASSGPNKSQTREDATLMADTLADKLSDLSFLKIPYDDIVASGLDSLKKTAVGGSLILDYIKKSEAFYHILSSRSRDYLISNDFRADKIVRIPNGIDINKFYPRPEKRPDPAKPERDILCVARMSFPKGVDVLLHAWYRMLSEPDEWRANLKPRLLIAGSGELEEQIERIARELGIEESVVFLGLTKDVLPRLQEAWGFVLPSRWEGMPNALLEAMACEVPCISTRVSGSEDIVEDGVNGLLVEPERPVELARALRRVIEDTDFAQGLAQKGLETIMRDYQLARVTERMLELYDRALGKEKPVVDGVLVSVEEK
jgi:glycosyltransferase involved in cell wall biosynthesis